jgi:hypothetical protein
MTRKDALSPQEHPCPTAGNGGLTQKDPRNCVETVIDCPGCKRLQDKLEELEKLSESLTTRNITLKKKLKAVRRWAGDS